LPGIIASAPVRVCDLGGWTDTWFGGPGRLVNIAVRPGVGVRGDIVPGPGAVTLDVPSFGDRYEVRPGGTPPGLHPILEAAVDQVPPPAGFDARIRVTSAHPPGCGTGTSAAVAVAVLGALHGLRGDVISAGRIAMEAHRLETAVLGRESGVQDHITAAHGGFNYIEIDAYPESVVTRLSSWPELEAGLSLVYLGQPHDSSEVHRQVIHGTGAERQAALESLRAAAIAGRHAIEARDLRALGRAAIANTVAQAALHPGLVGAAARRVIEAASGAGAAGWKVNGAGGDGGSVTILTADGGTQSAVQAVVHRPDAGFRVLPIVFSPDGLTLRSVPVDATMSRREGAQ
jgi:D-glycero-alpha-D-manno-heptose-7-phosphate kinase